MKSEILMALVLIVSNVLTGLITNSAMKKKQAAETSNYISEAYTKLVEDLQTQITAMKDEIEALKGEISALRVKNTDLSIKVKNLEFENKFLTSTTKNEQ
jgi:peptidoglycan hydrolase CwlO-like protein